jgi:hypothetical protein
MKYPWVSNNSGDLQGKSAHDILGRIFRRRWRDTLQAAQDGRYRP